MAYIGNRVVAGVGSAVKVDLDAPTNALRVKNDGNIGVGIAEPSSKLHVAGTVTATAFAGDGSALTGIESLPAAIDVNGSAPDDSLAIDSNGNVGIGTTSPTSYGLEVSKASGTSGIRSRSGSNSADFAISGSTLYITNNTTTGPTTFYTNGAERMRITSAGNVGIGTASPNYKLDVQGGALGGTSGNTVDVLQLYSNVGNSSYLNFQKVRTSTGSDWSSAGTRIQQVIDVTPQGYIQFNGDGNSYGISFGRGSTERMRIDSNGDVLPGANGTQDFGSTSLRWANIYTSDLHLSNGIGNYTIVEGEEDLFLYNNKNGKTYKFMLAEVDPSEAPKKMEK